MVWGGTFNAFPPGTRGSGRWDGQMVANLISVVEDEGDDMQWWGYNKEHGWVVLDRRIATNAPGIKKDLMFLRCRDSMTYDAKRESWNPPLYRFAPNYIRRLSPPESEEAAAELEGFKARWPEFERELQRECRETEKRSEAV